MAPATKYGGKIVLCQPGTMAAVKSKLTTVWTEMTSGVARPARSKDAVSYFCQWLAAPRQPMARIPYIGLTQRLRVRSRNVARSGIMPTYQNKSETVA